MSSVNRLEHVLHLLELLSVDSVVPLVDEKVVILLSLLLLLFESVEVLLPFVRY